MVTTDPRRSPAKTAVFCVGSCLVSMAAQGAAVTPPPAPTPHSVPAGTQHRSASHLSLYLFLHQTRFDSAAGVAGTRLQACHAPAMQTTRRGDAE